MTTLLAEVIGGDDLTEREMEILVLAADGDTAAETGDRLFLSVETVKGYRKKIIAKLEARNMAHAITIAFRTRLIS